MPGDDIGASSFRKVTIADGASLAGGINAVQQVYNAASSGTFTLKFKGEETAAIAYDAAAAAIKTALELLTGITTVTVTGAGTSGDPWIITFSDPGSEKLEPLGADRTNLDSGPVTITVTTPGEGTLLDVLGWEVVSIEQPASCEGTTFTMQGSLDGVNLFNIQTDSAEWSVTKSATLAQVIMISPAKRIVGFSTIRLRSGTRGTPTNQSTAASIKIGLARPR